MHPAKIRAALRVGRPPGFDTAGADGMARGFSGVRRVRGVAQKRQPLILQGAGYRCPGRGRSNRGTRLDRQELPYLVPDKVAREGNARGQRGAQLVMEAAAVYSVRRSFED